MTNAMPMYPSRDLYNIYKSNYIEKDFSQTFVDITKKSTLEYMNTAINACDSWNSFLDIGGGSGHYAVPLSKKFAKGTLVEVENLPEHIHIQEQFKNISIFNGFIETYETDAKFDFILLADLFEHIPNIISFSRKLSDLQTKGGVVYIITPNPLFCGPAPESAIYHTRHPNGHQKHYFKEEMIEIMAAAGYRLVFFTYEESRFRNSVKTFVKGISRRDKIWLDNVLYRLMRVVILVILKPIFYILERLTFVVERKKAHDAEQMMTQDLVFKKI